VTVNRVSFNGGNGGVQAQPTSTEREAEKEQHVPPVADQMKQEQAAKSDPQLRASANKGRPAVAAAELTGKGVKAATNPEESTEQAQARASQGAKGNASTKEDSQASSSTKGASQVPAPARNPGSNEVDEHAREDQQAMHDRQQREREDLQARQDAERKHLDEGPTDERARQQMEDEHARQTQELNDRHDRESAEFEQHHAASRNNGEDKRDNGPDREDNGPG